LDELKKNLDSEYLDKDNDNGLKKELDKKKTELSKKLKNNIISLEKE